METTSPSPRTWKLWERPTSPPAFQLQPRDVDILEAILRHRFMKPSFLAALLGSSEPKIARRCRLLWLNEYLERPPAMRPTRILTEQLTYGLGRKGAQLLEHLKPKYRIGDLDWNGTPAKQPGYPFIDHQLGIARAMVSFELACRQRGFVLHWAGHLHRRSWRIVPPGEDEAFLPDSYFGIEIPGKGLAHHFLELDRASVALRRMRDRFQKYFAFWKGAAEQRAFKHFRVLTVTEDRNHLDSLRRIAQPVGRENGYSRTWKGLLFAPLDIFDLEHPERVFDPVWRYADEEGPVSLVPSP